MLPFSLFISLPSAFSLLSSACSLFSDFPIFLFRWQLSLRSVSLVPLNFLLAVRRLSSTYNTLFALCPPHPALPGDIHHGACAAFILFRLLLWPERICAAGRVATPIKSSNIQIAQWNVNYALCASTRTKSDSRTHTHTHTQTLLSIPFALSSSTNSIIICADQFGCIIRIDRNMQNFKRIDEKRAWKGACAWAWQLVVSSNLAVANEANLKSLNRSA